MVGAVVRFSPTAVIAVAAVVFSVLPGSVIAVAVAIVSWSLALLLTLSFFTLIEVKYVRRKILVTFFIYHLTVTCSYFVDKNAEVSATQIRIVNPFFK